MNPPRGGSPTKREGRPSIGETRELGDVVIAKVKDLVAVFDFDQTLLDTSSIEPLRAARRWSLIQSRAGTMQFDLRIVQALQAAVDVGVTLAVASSAPRRYLIGFISSLPVTFDAVLGFHDVNVDKKGGGRLSRRASLKAGQLTLLIHRHPTARFVFVGDDSDDAAGASAARIPFIHACWGGDCTGIKATAHVAEPKFLVAQLLSAAKLPTR